MKAYLDIIKKILDEGVLKENRTGINTLAVAGTMFEHDMSEGFPLITTKNVPLRLVASELEFFIKGLTDKMWLKERDNHIWDQWCNPKKVPYSHDEETKAKMASERDLGPIYGWQWRNFGAEYDSYNKPPKGKGVDQLECVVDKLKNNPNDRRMIVSAWNPTKLGEMALPPCHWGFQVTVINDRLNLLWNQRSVDSALGLPFNIASYGLLLHLLAKESNLKEGKLIGFLGDTHIYVNHVDGLKEQLNRKPYPLPKLETDNFTSIFDWKYTDTRAVGYQYHPRIKFEIAV
ncbi:MAG TPA: thymidylate synthase [Candidatus Woesearchaeota archaeon]|nr:thymidylate synthase [Candidatus Woesearchaeota archaeon]